MAKRCEVCNKGPVVGRNVLVISTVEHADDVLRRQVGDAETIKVVVPVVRQGALDWLANDQKAFGHAERVAERTAEQLPGETIDAEAGEADVGLAIRDALATFPADEIVELPVEPALVTDRWAVLSLIGPKAAETLSAAGLPAPEQPYEVRALDEGFVRRMPDVGDAVPRRAVRVRSRDR